MIESLKSTRPSRYGVKINPQSVLNPSRSFKTMVQACFQSVNPSYEEIYLYKHKHQSAINYQIYIYSYSQTFVVFNHPHATLFICNQ